MILYECEYNIFFVSTLHFIGESPKKGCQSPNTPYDTLLKFNYNFRLASTMATRSAMPAMSTIIVSSVATMTSIARTAIARTSTWAIMSVTAWATMISTWATTVIVVRAMWAIRGTMIVWSVVSVVRMVVMVVVVGIIAWVVVITTRSILHICKFCHLRTTSHTHD